MIYEYTLGSSVKVFSDELCKEYVLADDYIDLQVDYKELEDKYYKMLEKIGDIWREG